MTNRVLECLRDDPFLSSDQLALLLGWKKRTLQWHLERARRAAHVRRYAGRQPGIRARALYALTRAGLKRLACLEGISLEEYLESNQYHTSRLDRLALVLERAFQVRSLLLHLQTAPWDWSMKNWDVEVELEFWRQERPIRVSFHGIALLKNQTGHSLGLVIEYDTNQAPVKSERLRLAHFCEGMYDGRYSQGFHENKFPVLVLIAADQERLNEYRSLLRGLDMIAGEVPETFFTTRDKLPQLYQDIHARIWTREFKVEEPVSLFSGIVGTPDPLSDVLVWQCLPPPTSFSEKRIELEPLAGEIPKKMNLHTMATLSFALRATDKQVLWLVASYPLLRATEIAEVLQVPVRCVRRSLKRLDAWGLVQWHVYPPRIGEQTQKLIQAERKKARARSYTLSEFGVHFLAASAGYGKAVERFARARGWRKRFDEVTRHWAHTQTENYMFLQLLRAARRFEHELIYWHSELEARLYIESSDYNGPQNSDTKGGLNKVVKCHHAQTLF